MQEDELMYTRLGFPLLPVPTYFPHSHKLEQSNVCHIEDSACSEARKVKNEMLVIMDEQQENQDQHDVSNASFQSSFSRMCSFKLNDMGYGSNRISPITFDGDAFQTPNNKRVDGKYLPGPYIKILLKRTQYQSVVLDIQLCVNYIFDIGNSFLHVYPQKF